MTDTAGTRPTIAGLEVGLPKDIDAVDADWLTSVLRASGAIDATTSVRSVAVEPFAVGAGLLSLLYLATLEYDRDGGPETVIVKIPTTDPQQRGVADQLAFYPREIFYYREIAPIAGLRTPKIHAAMIAEDSSDFVVVMENLSAYESRDQRAGVPWDDAIVAVRALGRFHARWWEHEQLDALSEIFLPIDFPGYFQALPQIHAGSWPLARQHGADVLPDEIVEFGERWGDLVAFFLPTMAGPRTLLHGDYRADNLFFDDGEIVAIDYQIVGVGNGAYDLGYFVSQSIAPDVRRGREAELVDAYVAALHEGGVDVDRGETDRLFRIAVAHCFIYGVTSFQAWDQLPDRSREVMLSMIERAGAAVHDLDSLSLLPS